MFFKKKVRFRLVAYLLVAFMVLSQINMKSVFALQSNVTALTLVSAVTDHIGKNVILTFDRPMKDPSGTQNQFTVVGKYTQYISSTNKGNFVIGNIPVTSVALGSDSKQIILRMSTAIQTGNISLDYTKGSVQAADETQLESFSAQSVTNNNNYSINDMVDFDYDATEIGYDTSDPSNPILKYKYNKLVDYDNVQLAWYFYNGFFGPMLDNINNYVKFYEKDTGNNVELPNILTRPNSPATYKDGTTNKNQQIVTDWYFWQLQHYAPLGLNLVSKSLKPSTTYVIEINKGFKYNNGAGTQKSYSFEFTTTADSLTKPYWSEGSSVTASNITENNLTLSWTAAQDNHSVTGYNLYQNGELLTTVNGDTTSYDVSNLLSGTEYKFKIEAVDFANNYSSDPLETTQVTSTEPLPPAAPNVTNDDIANTVIGMAAGMEYNLDNYGYIPYDADEFSEINFSGNHTLLIRVAASGLTPAGSVKTLIFTTNLPSWSGLSTLTAENITENSLKLSWSGVNDDVVITAYNIYKDGALIDTVNGNTTNYDITGLSPYTEYSFKIEAGDEINNWSTTGPTITIKTLDTTAPRWSVLSTLTAENITENSLKLNWRGAKDDIGITTYNIYKDGILIGTVNGNTTFYDVAGLNPDTEYTFKVEAIDASENISTTGPSVVIKSVPKTDETTNNKISDSSTGISVNGDIPEDVSRVLVAVIEDASKISEIDEDLSSAATESETYKTVAAYDISLLDDSNVKIQPNGTVTVSIPLSEELLNKKLVIFYVDDNGNSTMMDSTISDGVITFTTTHFSQYVIAEAIPVTSTDTTSDNENEGSTTNPSNSGESNTSDTTTTTNGGENEGSTTNVSNSGKNTTSETTSAADSNDNVNNTNLDLKNPKTGNLEQSILPILIAAIIALAGLILVKIRKKRLN